MGLVLCCVVLASLAWGCSPEAASASHRGALPGIRGGPRTAAGRGAWPAVARLRGGDAADETEYERERREKLAKNMEMMRSLGLSVGGGEIQKKVAARKRTRRKRLRPAPDQPVRRSARNVTKVKYVESSDDEDKKRKKVKESGSESGSSVSSSDSADDSDEDFGDSEPASGDDASVDLTPQKPRGRPPVPGRASKKGRAPEDLYGCPSWAPVEKVREVWGRLKKVRSAISERQNVKAYKIAHDRSLWEIAVNVPDRPVDLLRCWGMGMQKVESYGQELTAEVKACNATWTRPRSTLEQYTNPGSASPFPQRLYTPPQPPRTVRQAVYSIPPERPQVPVGSLFINGTWVYPKNSPPPPEGVLPYLPRPMQSTVQMTMWPNGSMMPAHPSPASSHTPQPSPLSRLPGPAWLRTAAPYASPAAAPYAASNKGPPYEPQTAPHYTAASPLYTASGIASYMHPTADSRTAPYPYAAPNPPPGSVAAADLHPIARGVEIPASHAPAHAVVSLGAAAPPVHTAHSVGLP